MKILVTGMTSRQANPDASIKAVSVAWLLTEAMRDAGHEVEFRNPHVEEDLDSFDRVFVGLAPLHGLGSNRAYGALSAILRTIADGRLTLYIDDPDLGKVISGIRTNVENPNRFTKAFFAYKLEHEIASQPHYKEWLASGIKMLNENAWPQFLIPVHAWADDKVINYYLKQAPQAVGNTCRIDLSAYLPEFEEPEVSAPRTRQWITESKPSEKWMEQQRLEWPVRVIRDRYEGKLKDKELVALYRKSVGVIQDPIKPVGWWHPRIGYAAQAGAVYCTKWQDVAVLGDAYTVLPDRVEYMTDDETADVAARQREAFLRATPDKDSVKETLSAILKDTVTA